MEGMEKGEEKEFSLTFPTDHPRAELAGKECTFKVAISEIKGERLPELNDEFAREVGEGLETLDALRERVTNDVRTRAEAIVQRRFEEKVLEAVVDLAQVEFPPVLVEREVDRLLREQASQFHQGRGGLEDYLRALNQTEQEVREELRPLAIKQVTSSLVLGKVAEEEKIEIGDSELEAEVEEIATSRSEGGEEVRRLFSSAAARESLERMLLTRKTVGRLVEIASSGELASLEGGDSEP